MFCLRRHVCTHAYQFVCLLLCLFASEMHIIYTYVYISLLCEDNHIRQADDIGHHVYSSSSRDTHCRPYPTKFPITPPTFTRGVLVAGRTHKRARSDFAQVQIQELEIFSLHPPCQHQGHEVKKLST